MLQRPPTTEGTRTTSRPGTDHCGTGDLGGSGGGCRVVGVFQVWLVEGLGVHRLFIGRVQDCRCISRIVAGLGFIGFASKH